MRAPWNGGQFVYIEWTDPVPNGEPIEAFEVQCRRTGREDWTTVSAVIHPRTMGFTATFCHGEPLLSDTDHELRVRARNSCGWSPWTSDGTLVEPGHVATCKTLPGEPARPEPPWMTSCSTAFLSVEWGEPHDGGSEVNAFEVQMKTTAERGARGPNRDVGYDWSSAIMPERVRWHTICDSHTINEDTRLAKGMEHYHTMCVVVVFVVFAASRSELRSAAVGRRA